MHEMSYQIIGMFLIYLRTATSKEGIHIFQSPAEAWRSSGETAQLDCKISEKEASATWYKEQQSGSLQWIYQSYESAPSDGKYSSKVNFTANTFSLIIHNVQRDDSGIYYCGLFTFIYLQPNFGNGTRLIVTDASEPRLSILAPSALEDAERPPVIPLLCLLSDFTPSWSAVFWDTGEEASEGQMDAGAIDGRGVFSVGSLMTIPSETWNQEAIYNCMSKESSTGRHISATISKETGRSDAEECMIALYVGLPCIFTLLLIQMLILLYKKCSNRGRTVQRRNQTHMRQIPQTEYATLPYNRRPPL